MKMLSNFTKNRYENLSPPHPSPLPRKAGGEGGDIRATSHLLKTPILSSFQLKAKLKSRAFPHLPYPAAFGGGIRQMAMVLSKKHFCCESYSPTRQAGWGLKSDLYTIELLHPSRCWDFDVPGWPLLGSRSIVVA